MACIIFITLFRTRRAGSAAALFVPFFCTSLDETSAQAHEAFRVAFAHLCGERAAPQKDDSLFLLIFIII